MSEYAVLTGKQIAHAAMLSSLEVAVDRLREAVNRHCSCGGRPDSDQQACDACRIWHEWARAMGAEGYPVLPF